MLIGDITDYGENGENCIVFHSLFESAGFNSSDNEKHCGNGKHNANGDPAGVCNFCNANGAVFVVGYKFAGVKACGLKFAFLRVYNKGRALLRGKACGN